MALAALVLALLALLVATFAIVVALEYRAKERALRRLVSTVFLGRLS